MKTTPIGPFLGLNNRLPDFSLQSDKGSYLASAVNVDIDNAGRVRRRNGMTIVQAMTGAHSLYLTSATAGFLVRNSVLYAIVVSPAYSETLVKSLSTDAVLHYVEHNGSVYCSNATDYGRIESGIWFPWALPTPAAPAVAPIAGALHAGSYQVAVRHYNSVTGEAGGISASTTYDLAAAGALQVTLPGATAGGTHIQVFVSELNGSQVYLHSVIIAGTGTADITTLTMTTPSEAVFAEPMPPCHNLCVHMGRLCGATGSRLYYGLSFRLGYYNAADGYIDFEDDITVVAPNQYGLFVATANKTYWFGGDISKIERITDPLPYGGVFGTAFAVPHKRLVGWFGDKGVVVGDEQGQVVAMMQDNVDVTLAGFPYSGVFEDRGYRRVVSCGYCMNLESGAATEYQDFGVVSISRGYGTTVDGIYLLSGTEAIDAHIGLGRVDFGVENMKRLPACYLGVSSATEMKLVVTMENGDYEYHSRSCGADMRIQRVDVGKGLRSNWYDLEVHNTNGSDFTLASVSFAPAASGRRI